MGAGGRGVRGRGAGGKGDSVSMATASGTSILCNGGQQRQDENNVDPVCRFFLIFFFTTDPWSDLAGDDGGRKSPKMSCARRVDHRLKASLERQ